MQKGFSDLEYAAKKKLRRRDRFVAEIDNVMPWGKLNKAVEPFYPKVEEAGRSPIGLARIVRVYVAQRCFGLSDESIKDVIYDSQSIHAFVGIDLGHESAPDATTLLKFCHLLEANGLMRHGDGVLRLRYVNGKPSPGSMVVGAVVTTLASIKAVF